MLKDRGEIGIEYYVILVHFLSIVDNYLISSFIYRLYNIATNMQYKYYICSTKCFICSTKFYIDIYKYVINL